MLSKSRWSIELSHMLSQGKTVGRLQTGEKKVSKQAGKSAEEEPSVAGASVPSACSHSLFYWGC